MRNLFRFGALAGACGAFVLGCQVTATSDEVAVETSAEPERLASGGELIPEQACYDVQHYSLALDVDPASRSILGECSMIANVTLPTSRIAIDLDRRFIVTGVEAGIDDDALHPYSMFEPSWEFGGGRIWVDFATPLEPGQTLVVNVDYEGAPRIAPRPPWDGGFTWETTADGRPWIATSCQGGGADLWWPCKDHPSDKPDGVSLSVTVPEGLVCASNGVLVSDESTSDGRHVWNWMTGHPISNYNVALNIAPYEVLRSSFESVNGRTVPVEFYVLPESVEAGRAALPEFIEDLLVFEELIGPYPFGDEKYGIVETPHLGMEHQTIIAYGNRFKGEDDGYDWLHNHEASHEWWANLVTCPDWNDMWVHEGFGTYMQALFLEKTRDFDAYKREMATKGAALKNNRPVAPRESKDSVEIYFSPDGRADNDIYSKGSWVLHTLRWTLGDDTFFRAFRRMAYPDPAMEANPEPRFATTDDMLAIAEEVAVVELDGFFEVYVRQPELPTLEVARSGDVMRLVWKLPIELASDQRFEVPVPITVDGEPRRIAMPGGEAGIEVPEDAEVVVDPDRWLLRAATMELARRDRANL